MSERVLAFGRRIAYAPRTSSTGKVLSIVVGMFVFVTVCSSCRSNGPGNTQEDVSAQQDADPRDDASTQDDAGAQKDVDIDQADKGRPSFEEKIHDSEQSAIEQCMNNRGFSYRRVPFSAPPDAVAFLSLSQAEELGYRAAYHAFMSYVIQPEAPDNALDLAAIQSYDTALIGGGAKNDAGCRAKGEALREKLLDESADGERLPDVDASFAVVVSSPDWAELSKRWYACMEEGGFNPESTDPFEHAESSYFGASRQARTAVADDVGAGAPAMLNGVEEFSAEDFRQALREYPRLQDVYRKEVRLALADQSCLQEAGLTEEWFTEVLRDSQ